jgi:hypothetical protein
MNHRDESNYIGGPRLLTLRRRPRTDLFDHESYGSERAKGSTSSRSALILTGLAPVSSKGIEYNRVHESNGTRALVQKSLPDVAKGAISSTLRAAPFLETQQRDSGVTSEIY